MPQLDKGFEVFVNWQTAMFCLGIYFTTYIMRTIVESVFKKVKEKGTTAHQLWNEAFLPLGPFGTGILIALLAKKFPWPMPIADVLSAKIMYGLICGGGSGWFYGRFRAWAKVADERKTKNSLPPPAASPKAESTPPEAAEPPKADDPPPPPADDPPPPAPGA